MYAEAFFSKLLGLEAPFYLTEIRHLDDEQGQPLELVGEGDPSYRPLDRHGQPGDRQLDLRPARRRRQRRRWLRWWR